MLVTRGQKNANEFIPTRIYINTIAVPIGIYKYKKYTKK